jgi:hypothetical protein
VAGDKDNRHLRQRLVALKLLAHLEATELGHVDIQEHQVGNGFARKLERQATRGCESKWSEVLKDVAQDANHRAVIVDQENAEFLLSLHIVPDRRLPQVPVLTPVRRSAAPG